MAEQAAEVGMTSDEHDMDVYLPPLPGDVDDAYLSGIIDEIRGDLADGASLEDIANSIDSPTQDDDPDTSKYLDWDES